MSFTNLLRVLMEKCYLPNTVFEVSKYFMLLYKIFCVTLKNYGSIQSNNH